MATAIPLLRFDPEGLFVRGTGVSPELLELVYPQLEAARAALLGGEPADVELVDEPDRIIADYRAHRQRSQLGRVLATARRLAEEVDRVVVVAGPGTLPAIRALVELCSHPFHNELSRAERGGQPRLYFAGDSLDNDRLAGLLDLVGQNGDPNEPQGSWGLVLIDEAIETKSLSATRRALWAALEQSTGGNAQQLSRRCVSICQRGSQVDNLVQESDGDQFEIAGGAGRLQSVFNAAGLLPAAVLGIDVRRLLEGAAQLNAQFRELPPAENAVLRYVGACHLLQDQSRAWTPALVPWADALRSFAAWHGEMPTSTIDPADLQATNQLRLARAGRTFPVNLLVDEVRRDRVSVGSGGDHAASDTLPDLLATAIQHAHQHAANSRQPWAELHLPHADPPSIGQLFQLFLIAPMLLARLPRVTRSSTSPVPSPEPPVPSP